MKWSRRFRLRLRAILLGWKAMSSKFDSQTTATLVIHLSVSKSLLDGTSKIPIENTLEVIKKRAAEAAEDATLSYILPTHGP